MALASSARADEAPEHDRGAGAHRSDRKRQAKPRRPAPGTVLTLADLGWPDTTRTIELRTAGKVYVEALGRGRRLGKLAAGTRVLFRSAVVGKRSACSLWAELEPAGTGWVCAAGATPSDEPPVAVAHPVERAPKRDYADVVKTSPVYASVEDVAAGTPARIVRSQTFVRLVGRSETIDGTKYTPTDQGLIAASALVRPEPSTFAGLDLATEPPPQWPFAWLYPKRLHGTIELLDAPDGRVVELGDARAIVPVLDERDGFVQIARDPDRWVDADDAHVARTTEPPAGIADGEGWIDVDVEQQVLIAYAGTTPVYATLVSTGRRTGGTPAGVYRIKTKTARTTMKNPPGAKLAWNVRDVPWAMSYRENFAVHGVYWHDAFGRKRSHGCVNLSPADAKWLWGWTLPAVPDGWIEVKAERDAGTAIRIRNRYHPDPPWRDFDGEEVEER
jgi:hypothetical protein